ncbi:alpha/beta hydrolase [Nocardioides sp.]|uniref:alpha/beta hydrolase n=1 Tax=Nocardioides sp. TaxID=35761 RepID=UPI003783BCBD
MSVRPEMRALAEAIWAAVATEEVEPGSPAALSAWRQGYDQFGQELPLPPGTSVRRLMLGSRPGELVTVGGAEPTRLVVFVHGGGYIVGSPTSHRSFAAHLAATAGVAVLLPDYRLSPEVTYGSAVEDVVLAFEHMLANGWDERSVVLGGDSAGGGVALAVTMTLRDRGRPVPSGLVLLSPWADMTHLDHGSRVTYGDEPMYDRDFTHLMANAVIGDGDPADPLVSPVLGDFTGLPRILVHVGSVEAMRDDGERVVERARAAGVDATLRVWPGAGHNFQVFPSFFPQDSMAWSALRDIAAFVA